MKLFKLTLLMILSIAMLTGCGGGGGSSNPVGATYDEELKTAYPDIYSSYTTMQTALESNTTDIDSRMASFMSAIATPFYDANDVSKRSDLESVTRSRLERYNVDAWSLVPFAHTKVDDNTVRVSTKMVLSVTLIPGKEGSGAGTYNFGDTTKGEPAIVFTWVKEADDKWRVQRGLPYRSDELF
ncbi:MAG: hypothetical protein A2W80_18350 [Candidatus Riflebacteria bacterium GWC2_50_8]|nr:MAG: hypothetical protein A2W80_18350 [Candidatus Riflebacteria bacterium GWC2_50_8]